MTDVFPRITAQAVHQRLLDRQETAFIDLREEDPYAQAHPLWACNLPLSRLELQAWRRIPLRDTFIVLYGEDDSGDLAPRAAERLVALGYGNVHLLEHGLEGWRSAGLQLFRDVNVPSKAFGEWVEHHRGTPSLSAQEVKALLDEKADVVVLDARRYDEYQTMNIPGSFSSPGAELALRARVAAPDPATRVIVNCAGRTRSIIGTQSLVNAGLPNPVAALRNGTIGWLLAGQTLEHAADRHAPSQADAATLQTARAAARSVADRAGVQRLRYAARDRLRDDGRTTYYVDVRQPQDYAKGHLPGFQNVPGGQLVQETDHTAAVRGARIVLADAVGVQADMTASWLAQMGWETYVLDEIPADALSETGAGTSPLPQPAQTDDIDAEQLRQWLAQGENVAVIDVAAHANYIQRHIPGAWFAIRAQLPAALRTIPAAERYVFTCGLSVLARFAAVDAAALVDAPVHVLDGGTQAWIAAGLPVASDDVRLANPATDRYRRPYEGTDAPAEAMQAYLDWEFGLVAQLKQDGTHHFQVV